MADEWRVYSVAIAFVKEKRILMRTCSVAARSVAEAIGDATLDMKKTEPDATEVSIVAALVPDEILGNAGYRRSHLKAVP